jgi:glycosyltransferase involved in cell wall biosynthesis
MKVHPDERPDLASLAENGWELVDPNVVAATPHAYRAFIQGSRAEIGIAKSGYVVSRCGWFSDRSACYLASGRPVVAQDTGFSQFIPTGEGLFAFDDEDGALAAIEAVRRDYARHSRAARQLAEEHLDSDRVLARLLGCVGA